MYQKKSNDNSFQTSNEIKSYGDNIFEQIKKKSEEITSSDTSIKLLRNLSNPTNLTNPQIIMDSKRFEEKIALRKNKNIKLLKKIKLKNKLIFSTANSSKNIRKSKSDISIINQSSSLISNDISKIIQNISGVQNLPNINNINYNINYNIDSMRNTQRNKIILRKIDKKNILNKNDNSQNNNVYKGYRNINIKKKNYLPEKISSSVKSVNYEMGERGQNFLEKLENSKNNILYKKNKKIDEIKPFNKADFTKEIYLIKILQYNTKNKNERYNKILQNKNNKIELLDNTMKKIEKSKNNIEDIYNKQYISYISFLSKTIEKENLIIIDLNNKKNMIIMENKIIQNKINKLKESKKDIIKWLYLQIQVKEKLSKIPNYYKLIIEENMSLKELNEKMKNNITKKEYNRILDYKGKNIYSDVNKFFDEYNNLEVNALKRLKNNSEFSDTDNIKLKNEFENDNTIEKIKVENNMMINDLNKELEKTKNNNIYLNNELYKIKNNKNNKNNKNKNISRNKNINKYISNLSNKILIHSISDSNYNLSNYIYYKKEKSLLFNLILFLYKWVSQNKFKELKDVSVNIDSYLTDEENMLNILRYSESVVNLLLVEKKYYYSNDKLKNIYKKNVEIIEKEIKREKFLMQLKIEKQKQIEKQDKINEKMNKKYFKYNRKIDYDYFRKDMNKKNKLNLNKIEVKETKFEDFFYDNY